MIVALVWKFKRLTTFPVTFTLDLIRYPHYIQRLRDLASEGHLETIIFNAKTEEEAQASYAQETLKAAFDILRTSAMASKVVQDPPVARQVIIYLMNGIVDVRTVHVNNCRTAL